MTDTQFLACCAAVFATSGLASFLRTYLLGLVTARTARRLRKEAFDVILSSEMEFFDTKEVSLNSIRSLMWFTRWCGGAWVDCLKNGTSGVAC